MINFDDVTKEKIFFLKKKNPSRSISSWLSIQNISIGGSGSEKTNLLLNLINQQPDIDKIYFYAKDPYEAKHQFLINKWNVQA